MLPSWIRSRNCRPRFGVLLRDRHDETEVGFDQLLLGLFRLDLAARDGLERPHQLLGRLLELLRHRLHLRPDVFLTPDQQLLFFFLQPALSSGLGIDLALDLIDLALQPHHPLDPLLDLVDQPALHQLGELDLADHLGDVDAGAQRLPAGPAVLPLLPGRLSPRDLFELLFRFLERQPGLADVVDLPQDLPLAVVDLLVGDLLVIEDDELAHAALIGAELIAHRHDRAGGCRSPGDRLDDRQLSTLDAFGDLDFTFARQEGNRAHLAQIHADGIVGLVERARREIELDFLGPFSGAIEKFLFPVGLLRVYDLDTGAAESAEQVVELV